MHDTTISERNLLGAVLVDGRLWEIASALPSDYFLNDSHRLIHRAMAALASKGHEINPLTVADELEARKELPSVGGRPTLTDLTTGAVTTASHLRYCVQRITQAAGVRHIREAANAIALQAQETGTTLPKLRARVLSLDGELAEYETGARTIRKLEDIPDIMALDIAPIDYLVDGMISRKSMTLWSGIDGTAKTLLALKMAIAVALGTKFLGRCCHQSPVLYLDYENPDFAVRQRLDIMAGGPIPGFTVWGTWVDPQPPQIGDPVLLDIAQKHQPLMVVDPFRYAHTAEENDSTEMMGIMRHLRSYASAGAAVVVLHHPARAEGSTGRGSTAIRGAVDVAYLQEMNEDGLITLRCVKNRFGEKWAVTLRPDYEQGSFELTDSPEFTKRADEVERIRQTIAAKPGMSQSQVHQATRINKNRLVELLKQHDGVLWQAQRNGQAWAYYPPVSGA